MAQGNTPSPLPRLRERWRQPGPCADGWGPEFRIRLPPGGSRAALRAGLVPGGAAVRIIALCLLLAATLAACKSKESGAKEEFARAHSCPGERIAVKARPDLDWQTVVFGDIGPPPGIAADPGRLARWKADRADLFGDLRVFEAQGCGRHDYLGCRHPKRPDRNGSEMTVVSQVVCERRGVGEPTAAAAAAGALASAESAQAMAAELLREAAGKRAERDRKRAEREQRRAKREARKAGKAGHDQ